MTPQNNMYLHRAEVFSTVSPSTEAVMTLYVVASNPAEASHIVREFMRQDRWEYQGEDINPAEHMGFVAYARTHAGLVAADFHYIRG